MPALSASRQPRRRPSESFMAPVYMQTGNSFARDVPSIHSMRSDSRPRFGTGASSADPAPSDSIQRRKSFSKARPGRSEAAATCSGDSAEKLRATMNVEQSSDPVATARRASPDLIIRYANLSAATPEHHTPAVETASSRASPSSAWTMAAWPGFS
jgi:hypothetical protein